MITKYAMVVLAGDSDESKEKEKKPSLLRRVAPGIGAAVTTVAGNKIRGNKLFDAVKELYPTNIADKKTLNAEPIEEAHKTLDNKLNQLKNDDTRMGKINYFIAKQLLKRPTKRAQSSLDLLQKIKSNPNPGNITNLMGAVTDHVMNTSDMYSIMKNPKLNALGYGMSKAFPLYVKYLLAKHIYRYGKKGFNMLKNKINAKKNQPMLLNETESPIQ
jgi:hypothetical protein